MPNANNLIPQSERTLEERQAIGRLGGIQKGINAKKRKTMQEDCMWLLTKAIQRGKLLDPEQYESMAELIDLNITVQQAILLSQAQKAIAGDTQAAIFIRDTLGEKPIDKVELGMSIEEYVKSHKPKF